MTCTEARRHIAHLVGQVHLTLEQRQAIAMAMTALGRYKRMEDIPKQAGKPWDALEDSQLCDNYDAGYTIAVLASMHQRTRGAITSRLARLGRLVPPTA